MRDRDRDRPAAPAGSLGYRDRPVGGDGGRGVGPAAGPDHARQRHPAAAGRQRLAGDAAEWIGAAGRERVDALCAELDRLPDQERARPDPVYQLAALRKG